MEALSAKQSPKMSSKASLAVVSEKCFSDTTKSRVVAQFEIEKEASQKRDCCAAKNAASRGSLRSFDQKRLARDNLKTEPLSSLVGVEAMLVDLESADF